LEMASSLRTLHRQAIDRTVLSINAALENTFIPVRDGL
jgi:hypothetical protein